MPKGTLVIRAAEMLGIQIPRFCDHPLLDPIGACRQCLVDVEGQRKPLASCTTVVHRGHGGEDPAHLAGRGQGAAGRDGAAAHQPPARLPDVRQGRRVPAAEPGHVQRPGRDHGSREHKRTFDKPVRDLHRGAARPRALHLLHPLRADLGGDRRRRLHRLPRARPEPVRSAPRRASRSTPTSPATPCRSARSARSPAPPTGSSPGRSTWSPCRACASTAPSGCHQRTDHRRGKVMRRLAGDDPAVNEEWNCDKGRWAFTYATQPDRLTTPLVRDEDGVLVPASWPHALAVAAAGLAAPAARPFRPRRAREDRAARGRRADRRQADPRGRLRVRQVRPGRAGHQRRRHAGPAALGGGGAVPGPLRGRARHRRQLRRPGAGARGAAGRVRARGRVADRLPAAAQGGPPPRPAGRSPSRRSPAPGWSSCPASS